LKAKVDKEKGVSIGTRKWERNGNRVLVRMLLNSFIEGMGGWRFEILTNVNNSCLICI